MNLLEGKTAIVTGSGRGIGRAVAQMLCAHGARVIVNDLDAGPAEETAELIRGAGGEVAAVAGSVIDAAVPARLVQTALDSFGSLDIIVNNAGYTWDGVIHKMSDEQFDAMLDVHLKAPFRIVRAAADYLRGEAKKAIEAGERPPCRKIVNVSSTTGVAGNAGQINYAAGKMGIVGMTKTIAKEWGRFNICCNAVAYGFIETRLTQAKEKGDATSGRHRFGHPASTAGRRSQLHPARPHGNAGRRRRAGAVLVVTAV